MEGAADPIVRLSALGIALRRGHSEVHSGADRDGGHDPGPYDPGACRKRGPEPSQVNIRLTDSQRAVFEYFADLDKGDHPSNPPKLVPIFLGALEVINGSNPDRFALASHNLRELIKFVPPALLDEVHALDKRLKDEVAALESRWTTACKSSSRDDKGRWSGEIDPSLKGFLSKAGAFFDWFHSNDEARQQETSEALHQLGVSEQRLSPALATLNARDWQRMAQLLHFGLPSRAHGQ